MEVSFLPELISAFADTFLGLSPRFGPFGHSSLNLRRKVNYHLQSNIWLPFRFYYSIRKSINLMISIPSTDAVEFVFIVRITFL